MRNRKGILCRIVSVLLVLLLLPSVGVLAAETLSNGELNNAVNGVPEGWNVQSYLSGSYSVSAENGVVTLFSSEANDLRLCQTVEVEEKTVYVLSAEVSVERVSGGRGATISIDNYSIDGSFVYSNALSGNSNWMTVQLPFLTGVGQRAVNVALRLGGYSETSTGTARFRNVRFERAAGTVEGLQDLQAASYVGQNHSDSSRDDSEAHKIFLKSVPHLFIVLTIVLAAALLFGVYRHRNELTAREISELNRKRVFALLVLGGLILRSALCARWRGHDSDMSCWIGWGNYIAQNGTAAFYTASGHEWYDYPPGYMLVLGAISKIMQILGISSDSAAGTFAYMLPAYFADIGIALLLMRFARGRGWSKSWCLLLGGLVIFNPAAVVLSGAWGQIDSILTLFLLLSFTELLAGRRITAGAFYGLAVIFKWQALIYGPVLAAAYLFTIRQKREIWETISGVAAAFAVIFLISLPFRGSQRPLWLIGRFLNATGGYDYASVEAYNFLTLLGGNWAGASSPIFPGVSYKAFGTAAIILSVLLAIFSQGHVTRRELLSGAGCERSRDMLFLAAAFCMYAIFTFGHYMHERYVFPVIFLLLFAFVCFRDPRLLFCSLLLSCVLFLNECTAMYVISEMASSVVRSGREHQTAVAVGSVAETLSFLLFFAVWLNDSLGGGEEVKENA